jgi:hypothetical protein
MIAAYRQHPKELKESGYSTWLVHLVQVADLLQAVA